MEKPNELTFMVFLQKAMINERMKNLENYRTWKTVALWNMKIVIIGFFHIDRSTVIVLIESFFGMCEFILKKRVCFNFFYFSVEIIIFKESLTEPAIKTMNN